MKKLKHLQFFRDHLAQIRHPHLYSITLNPQDQSFMNFQIFASLTNSIITVSYVAPPWSGSQSINEIISTILNSHIILPIAAIIQRVQLEAKCPSNLAIVNHWMCPSYPAVCVICVTFATTPYPGQPPVCAIVWYTIPAARPKNLYHLLRRVLSQ